MISFPLWAAIAKFVRMLLYLVVGYSFKSENSNQFIQIIHLKCFLMTWEYSFSTLASGSSSHFHVSLDSNEFSNDFQIQYKIRISN